MYRVVSPRVLREQGFCSFVDTDPDDVEGDGCSTSGNSDEERNNIALERLFATAAEEVGGGDREREEEGHSHDHYQHQLDRTHTFYGWDSF